MHSVRKRKVYMLNELLHPCVNLYGLAKVKRQVFSISNSGQLEIHEYEYDD